MTPESRMVSVRNGMFQVQLSTAGQGEPLVFLHGGNGVNWSPFLEDLSRSFTVYVPRHPGWGESSGLDNLDDCVDMALFYLDFFDTLGLSSVNLLGTSLGGMFAAEIAALGGPYVKKLILQAPVGLWLDEVPAPDIFTLSPDEAARATFFDPAAAQALMPQVDPEDKEAVAKANFERIKAQTALAKFIWPIWDKGLKKRIHRIKAPTLLVWGDSDGLVPPAYGDEFKRRIPGSQLVIMPKTGHVPMVEQREAFARIVTDFFKS